MSDKLTCATVFAPYPVMYHMVSFESHHIVSASSGTLPHRRIYPMAQASPVHIYLDLISQNAVSSRDAPRILTAMFDAKGYDNYIENLDKLGIHPQAYIDGLDRVSSCPLGVFSSATLTLVPQQILDTLNIQSQIYRRGLRALRKTCGIYGLLPSSYTVSGELTLVTTGHMRRPFASGGYSDVWKAFDCEGHIFAIKQLRVYLVDDLKRVEKVITNCRHCFSP